MTGLCYLQVVTTLTEEKISIQNERDEFPLVILPYTHHFVADWALLPTGGNHPKRKRKSELKTSLKRDELRQVILALETPLLLRLPYMW